MFNTNKYAIKGRFTNYDPRAAIIAGIVLIFAVIFVRNYAILTGAIILCAILLAGNTPVVLKRLLAVNLLTAFIWLTLPFTVVNGAQIAVLYTLRINACALIFMVFIVPMGISTISNALIAMKCPGKLVSLLILTHRYIHALGGSLSTALTAMQLRKPENIGTLRLWRTYAALFATALTTAALRSERVQQAMLLRGFDGNMPSTAVLKWKKTDAVFIISTVSIALIMCYIQICSK